MLARRAALFAAPRPIVFHVEGRTLLPGLPEPYPGARPAAGGARAVRPADRVLRGDGRREYGVLLGEVDGLEVCRATTDPATGAARLEVGVGAHDREAFLLIHGDVPPAEPLARIVAEVRRHRTLGADPHPLNRLGAERLLRTRVLADPASVGAAWLRPSRRRSCGPT